jgi:hypothetical protein
MATITDAIYSALETLPQFTGKVFRDRPGGSNGILPYAVIRGDVEHDRRLDLDGQLRRSVRRIDILDDDGQSSELVDEMSEAAATLFDDDPGLAITGFQICGVSSQGPADLPPDVETYGRSVLVTLWLEKE